MSGGSPSKASSGSRRHSKHRYQTLPPDCSKSTWTSKSRNGWKAFTSEHGPSKSAPTVPPLKTSSDNEVFQPVLQKQSSALSMLNYKSTHVRRETTPRRLEDHNLFENVPAITCNLDYQIESTESQPELNRLSSSGKLKRFLEKVSVIKRTPSNGNIFGKPIESLIQDPSNPNEIPIVLRQCVDYLMTHNAHLVEGIFRKSGSHEVIESLRDMYCSPTAEADLDSCSDTHCVAVLLKQFLVEMADPLIPHVNYDSLSKKFSECQSTPERIVTLKIFMDRLPANNRAVLVYVMRFLNRVSKSADINLMTSKNLGLVFGPTVMRPAVLDQVSMLDRTNTEVVACMIENYQCIF